MSWGAVFALAGVRGAPSHVCSFTIIIIHLIVCKSMSILHVPAIVELCDVSIFMCSLRMSWGPFSPLRSFLDVHVFFSHIANFQNEMDREDEPSRLLPFNEISMKFSMKFQECLGHQRNPNDKISVDMRFVFVQIISRTYRKQGPTVYVSLVDLPYLCLSARFQFHLPQFLRAYSFFFTLHISQL